MDKGEGANIGVSEASGSKPAKVVSAEVKQAPKTSEQETRDQVLLSFNRIKKSWEDSLGLNPSDKDKWSVKAVNDAVEKTGLQTGKGDQINHKDKGLGQESFTTSEGVPIEQMLEWIDHEIAVEETKEPQNQNKAQLEEYKRDRRIVAENSKSWLERNGLEHVSPDQLAENPLFRERTNYEAQLISRDDRKTSSPEEDWYLAERTLKARRELVLPSEKPQTAQASIDSSPVNPDLMMATTTGMPKLNDLSPAPPDTSLTEGTSAVTETPGLREKLISKLKDGTLTPEEARALQRFEGTVFDRPETKQPRYEDRPVNADQMPALANPNLGLENQKVEEGHWREAPELPAVTDNPERGMIPRQPDGLPAVPEDRNQGLVPRQPDGLPALVPPKPEPKGQPETEIVREAVVGNFLARLEKAARDLAVKKVNELQRAGSLREKVVSRVLEKYKIHQAHMEIRAAMKANNNVNLDYDIRTHKVIGNANAGKDQQQEEAKAVQQMARDQLGAGMSMSGQELGTDIKEAQGPVKDWLMTEVVRRIVDSSLPPAERIVAPEQAQEKILSFVRANINNPQYKELTSVFGADATQYNVVTDALVTTIFEMSQEIKQDIEAQKYKLNEIDKHTRILLASPNWAAQTEAGNSYDAIDRLMARIGDNRIVPWLVNPAVLGLFFSIGGYGVKRAIGDASRAAGMAAGVAGPGLGVVTGAISGGLHRYNTFAEDRATHKIESTYNEQTVAGSKNREKQERFAYDQASIDNLINGGGTEIITGTTRKSMAELLSANLAESANRDALARRVAEMRLRFNLSQEQREDWLGFAGKQRTARDSSQVISGIVAGRNALLAAGIPVAQVNSLVAGFEGQWESGLLTNKEQQDKAFQIQRLKETAKAAVYGGVTGLAFGLISQESIALGTRWLGGAAGETALEGTAHNIAGLMGQGAESNRVLSHLNPDITQDLFQHGGSINIGDGIHVTGVHALVQPGGGVEILDSHNVKIPTPDLKDIKLNSAGHFVVTGKLPADLEQNFAGWEKQIGIPVPGQSFAEKLADAYNKGTPQSFDQGKFHFSIDPSHNVDVKDVAGSVVAHGTQNVDGSIHFQGDVSALKDVQSQLHPNSFSGSVVEGQVHNAPSQFEDVKKWISNNSTPGTSGNYHNEVLKGGKLDFDWYAANSRADLPANTAYFDWTDPTGHKIGFYAMYDQPNGKFVFDPNFALNHNVPPQEVEQAFKDMGLAAHTNLGAGGLPTVDFDPNHLKGLNIIETSQTPSTFNWHVMGETPAHPYTHNELTLKFNPNGVLHTDALLTKGPIPSHIAGIGDKPDALLGHMIDSTGRPLEHKDMVMVVQLNDGHRLLEEVNSAGDAKLPPELIGPDGKPNGLVKFVSSALVADANGKVIPGSQVVQNGLPPGSVIHSLASYTGGQAPVVGPTVEGVPDNLAPTFKDPSVLDILPSNLKPPGDVVTEYIPPESPIMFTPDFSYRSPLEATRQAEPGQQRSGEPGPKKSGDSKPEDGKPLDGSQKDDSPAGSQDAPSIVLNPPNSGPTPIGLPGATPLPLNPVSGPFPGLPSPVDPALLASARAKLTNPNAVLTPEESNALAEENGKIFRQNGGGFPQDRPQPPVSSENQIDSTVNLPKDREAILQRVRAKSISGEHLTAQEAEDYILSDGPIRGLSQQTLSEINEGAKRLDLEKFYFVMNSNVRPVISQANIERAVDIGMTGFEENLNSKIAERIKEEIAQRAEQAGSRPSTLPEEGLRSSQPGQSQPLSTGAPPFSPGQQPSPLRPPANLPEQQGPVSTVSQSSPQPRTVEAELAARAALIDSARAKRARNEALTSQESQALSDENARLSQEVADRQNNRNGPLSNSSAQQSQSAENFQQTANTPRKPGPGEAGPLNVTEMERVQAEQRDRLKQQINQSTPGEVDDWLYHQLWQLGGAATDLTVEHQKMFTDAVQREEAALQKVSADAKAAVAAQVAATPAAPVVPPMSTGPTVAPSVELKADARLLTPEQEKQAQEAMAKSGTLSEEQYLDIDPQNFDPKAASLFAKAIMSGELNPETVRPFVWYGGRIESLPQDIQNKALRMLAQDLREINELLVRRNSHTSPLTGDELLRLRNSRAIHVLDLTPEEEGRFSEAQRAYAVKKYAQQAHEFGKLDDSELGYFIVAGGSREALPENLRSEFDRVSSKLAQEHSPTSTSSPVSSAATPLSTDDVMDGLPTFNQRTQQTVGDMLQSDLSAVATDVRAEKDRHQSDAGITGSISTPTGSIKTFSGALTEKVKASNSSAAVSEKDENPVTMADAEAARATVRNQLAAKLNSSPYTVTDSDMLAFLSLGGTAEILVPELRPRFDAETKNQESINRSSAVELNNLQTQIEFLATHHREIPQQMLMEDLIRKYVARGGSPNRFEWRLKNLVQAEKLLHEARQKYLGGEDTPFNPDTSQTVEEFADSNNPLGRGALERDNAKMDKAFGQLGGALGLNPDGTKKSST